MWGLHLDNIVRLNDQKLHITPHFDHLIPRNAKVSLTVLLPAPLVTHDQKSHIAPDFNHLNIRNAMCQIDNTVCINIIEQKGYVDFILIVVDLRKAMVPLMIPLASYVTDANNNGIT